MSACGADFMSPKHPMHTQRCFGMAISVKSTWIGLFGLLSSYSHCACDAAFPGAKSTHPNNHTHAVRGFRHILLATLSLSRPVGGSPCIENIACDSDIFPENSNRQKTKYHWIELFTSRYQHSGTVNDANRHGRHFFSLLNAVVWI